MAIETVRDVLVAAGAVTALVGQRVSPLIKEQNITLPAVTLQRISLTPINALDEHAGLDQNAVQVDSWATTYAEARSIADACRAALQSSDILMSSEFDNYDSEVNPEQYRITQQFQVWI